MDQKLFRQLPLAGYLVHCQSQCLFAPLSMPLARMAVPFAALNILKDVYCQLMTISLVCSGNSEYIVAKRGWAESMLNEEGKSTP